LARDVCWEFHDFIIKLGCLILADLYICSKKQLDSDWIWIELIGNPFKKLELDLDWQSPFCDGFGLD